MFFLQRCGRCCQLLICLGCLMQLNPAENRKFLPSNFHYFLTLRILFPSSSSFLIKYFFYSLFLFKFNENSFIFVLSVLFIVTVIVYFFYNDKNPTRENTLIHSISVFLQN